MNCDKCDGTGQIVDQAALQARIASARCPRCEGPVNKPICQPYSRATSEDPVVFCNDYERDKWSGLLSECKQEPQQPKGVPAGCELWELEIYDGKVRLKSGRVFMGAEGWGTLDFAPRDPRFVGCGYVGPDNTVVVLPEFRAWRDKLTGAIVRKPFSDEQSSCDPILPRWVIMREMPCEF